jgi:hypothetical protein
LKSEKTMRRSWIDEIDSWALSLPCEAE